MRLHDTAHLLPHGLACALEDGLGRVDDNVPELLVLLAGDERDADRLAVVRRGGERENLLDNLLDAAVGDLGGALEAVDGAAVLGGGEPVVGGNLGGRHFEIDCEYSCEDEEEDVEDCGIARHFFTLIMRSSTHYLYSLTFSAEAFGKRGSSPWKWNGPQEPQVPLSGITDHSWRKNLVLCSSCTNLVGH